MTAHLLNGSRGALTSKIRSGSGTSLLNISSRKLLPNNLACRTSLTTTSQRPTCPHLTHTTLHLRRRPRHAPALFRLTTATSSHASLLIDNRSGHWRPS